EVQGGVGRAKQRVFLGQDDVVDVRCEDAAALAALDESGNALERLLAGHAVDRDVAKPQPRGLARRGSRHAVLGPRVGGSLYKLQFLAASSRVRIMLAPPDSLPGLGISRAMIQQPKGSSQARRSDVRNQACRGRVSPLSAVVTLPTSTPGRFPGTRTWSS